MCIAMKSSLLFLIIFALAVANSKSQTPNEVPNTMIELDEAWERKDIITVLFKMLDLYEDAVDNDENFVIKDAIVCIKFVLKKIYPIYVTIYPEKKSPNDETSLKIVSDAIDNVDYAKDVYSDFEELMMDAVQDYLRS
ncbi:PREDICTED: uncharacterized protein LOC108560587 [Nicrophorus vespilloides]|uniref:Uncharacterized protein LOC108560587 n=1 Tax=Nicrophorus vespilloides TaxID=110193 RepID=A0ABM1MGK0_NICVS|nr:PREDICTED: uncharacterized protein LOC108560587 [Nicrophorus vespilloides]